MSALVRRNGERTRERRRALAILAVLALAVVPASIAWACNPQAYLRLSPTTVAPGSTLNVSGAFFKGGASLTITIEGGASTSVTTSPNGSFSTTMPAPNAPGSYTVSAVGYEADGTVTNGLPARASFTVSGASQQPGSGGLGARPGGSDPGTQPGAPRQGTGGFAEPEVPTAQAFSEPRSGSRGGGRPAAGGGAADSGPGAVNAGAGVIDSSTGAVFAGSIARQERVAESRSDTKRGTPSERSAGSDAWAGFDASKAPSLAPASGEAVPGGGAGSQLGWGLGLLGLGFVAFVAGLAASEARRRKAIAG